MDGALAGRRIASGLQAEGFEASVYPGSDYPTATELDALLSKFPGRYLHPGLSAWADRPELLMLAQKYGLVAITPPSRALTLFGNKFNFLQQAEALQIPTLVIPPGEPIHSIREIEILIRRGQVHFPFALKSALGSAALGLIVIQDSKDLESKLPLWIEQLRLSVGEAILFCERYIEGAHAITVPFARFADGRSTTFPFVDGSLQCRYRKVVEFCPAFEPADARLEAQLQKWTLQMAEHAGYIGVGALEFLVDGGRPHLIGGLARLDAAFPIWEQVAGTRAVAWQLATLSSSGSTAVPFPASSDLSGPFDQVGVALSLYAEDPIMQLPQPGQISEVGEKRQWSLGAASAELELAVEPGGEVSPHDHGLIGKIWISARNRAQAVITARGVLDELWIAGSLQTNERFLSELLAHPWVKEGIFHAGFIDEEFLPALRPPKEMLVLFAAVLREYEIEGARWSVGDQWVKPQQVEVHWIDRTPGQARIQVPDGRELRVCTFPLSASKWLVRIGSWVMMTRQVQPSTHKKQLASGANSVIRSLVSGRVHSVLYRNGATVLAHEPLLIVESLGMLIPHALPKDVRIQHWKVSAEDRVISGQELAELEIVAQ